MNIRPAFNPETPVVWRRSVLYAGQMTVVGELVDPAAVSYAKRRDLYASRLIDNAPETEPEVVAKKAPKKKRAYKKRTPKDSVLGPLSKLDTRKA